MMEDAKAQFTFANCCFDGPPPLGFDSWKSYLDFSLENHLFQGIKLSLWNGELPSPQ